MRDFPYFYLRLGIRDFKAKSGRDSGLKACAGGGMPKVTLGITGLPEIWGRDRKTLLGTLDYEPSFDKRIFPTALIYN